MYMYVCMCIYIYIIIIIIHVLPDAHPDGPRLRALLGRAELWLRTHIYIYIYIYICFSDTAAASVSVLTGLTNGIMNLARLALLSGITLTLECLKL